MDCCSTKTPTETIINVEEVLTADPENAPSAKDDPNRSCLTCGRGSRPVTRKTMLLMLKPELFDRISEGQYRFCSDPDCSSVYFTETSGTTFAKDDLRVRVGVKEKSDPIPLCYCFGFFETDLREEIAKTGRITIPQRIIELLKAGMCACPSRNPSGACCLGEVTITARELMKEAHNPTK
jgi:hypothetical protein